MGPGPVVHARISTVQADGTDKSYEGTYTVHDGVITAADIHEVGPRLGGDAYWLADGGPWTVHGSQLQISQGPSGLIGTQTWNAGGNIDIGHAQLAFTSNADGSLTGTYIATGTLYLYQGTASWLHPGAGRRPPAEGPDGHAGAGRAAPRQERVRRQLASLVRRRQHLPVPGRPGAEPQPVLRRLT